jgi:hypothetical protein
VSKDRTEHYAFARGYYDARSEGIERNPYETESERAMYRDGYEWGIADYCTEAHPEEVNQ